MKYMNFAIPAKRVFLFAAFAAGLYGAAVFLTMAYLRSLYPYMVGLGEPALSQAIRWIAEGKIPYRELTSPPYTLVPYGPVYPGLAALAGRCFSSPFTGGRLLAFLATAGSSFLIYSILRKSGTRKTFSILPALLFISMPYVRVWGVMVNVDMAGTFLDLAAFYLWYCYAEKDSGSEKFFIGGIVLSIAAFFTKSSMIAAPAAFFCFLVCQKQFKKAFFLFFFQAAAAGFIYLFLSRATDGAYFFHTAYEISRRSFFYQFIFRFWGSTLLQAPLLAAASIFALWNGAHPGRSGRQLFFSLYVLFVLLLTFSLGKQGSDTNYFLPWAAVSSAAAGMALQGRRAWLEATLLILILGQLCFWIYPERNLVQMKNGYQNAREFFDQISLAIKKVNGDILSEDMSLLVANGRPIFYEPFPMGQMSHNGVWDQQLILRELDRQRFPVAILYFYAPLIRRNRTFTLEFMEKFNEKYRFVGRASPSKDTAGLVSNPLYIYAPKK